jgi:LuxR family maltose regulon positive regulatory protein
VIAAPGDTAPRLSPARRLTAVPARGRPPFRPGLVPRERLVARLAATSDVPLVLVVAPAGYGKTTVLAEWAEQDRRPFAWLALDEGDNDVGRLLEAIALAVDEIEPVGRDVFAALAAGDHGVSGLAPALLAASLGRRRPFVLVLDDAQVLRAPRALGALQLIAEHLPAGSQLAIASRTEPALPIGRLRAHRRLEELRARDLVMTRGEAGALLTGLGVRAGDVDLLVRRTEGWPAGLYLAALSLQEEPDRDRALARFAGDDRLVADYLREEMLAGLPCERLTFLTRTSVLGDLSGPLCDAVLDRPGSGGTLRELSRANLMLVPLDRTDDRYRYHGLLAEMLQAELRRREPEREAELHRRASAWHAERGEIERAIHHAIAARDVATAGDLLWGIAARYITDGRSELIRRWLDRFTADQIAEHPALALTAAASELATGDRNLVEHWASVAERRLRSAEDGDATRSKSAVIAVLRALLARDGVASMGREAAGVCERLHDDVAWRTLCCLLQGAAEHLLGHREPARAHLDEGARYGAVAARSIQVLCLAQLALIAVDGDDWVTAETLAARARSQVECAGLGDHPTCALVHAVSALVRAQRGRVDDAQHDVREGRRLLAVLADFAPWYEAEVRLVIARAALRLGDVVGARTLLAEASRLARRVPDAVVLRTWLDEVWGQADTFSAAALLGPSSLTPAELRVLRLLPTHLSFPEIAGRLHVSANTIKTQAHSVYRKLDASSRTEAVANAGRVGLIDTW